MKLNNLLAAVICTTFASTFAHAEPANPFTKGQIWKGSYACAQGQTDLTLRIKNSSTEFRESDLGNSFDIEAIFDFDYNNRTAAGSFYLNGNYYPESKVATLDPGQWIRKPKGYNTVGMDGVISNNGKIYSGKILFNGCRDFRVQLQN